LIIKINKIFKNLDFLSSREKALELRILILKTLQSESSIVLDFEGFDLVTQAFADELIGVLVRDNGLNFVKNNIPVKASSSIKEMFNFVIGYSVKN
jgi:hypothetical protein